MNVNLGMLTLKLPALQVHELLVTAMRAGLLVMMFVVLNGWVMAVTHLPVADYFEPVMFTGIARQLFGTLKHALVTVCVIGVLLLRWRFVAAPWSRVEHGVDIRLYVTVLAAVLAWNHATYDYNLYFDRAHYYDRFTLLALVFLVYWRPLFVLPFVLVLTVTGWQFHEPILPNSWAQTSMPLRLLMLFVCAHFLAAVTGVQRTIDWLFVGCCIVAAHYWVPGLNKLGLAWPTYGHVHHFMLSTYANGWLGFMNAEEVSRTARFVALLDWPIVIATLVLQIGSVLLLVHRFTLLGLLAAWAVFHLGILGLAGIFFWQWIVVEAGLLMLLRRLWARDPIPFISIPHLLVSVLLIGASKLWLPAVGLAWYDMRASYTFRFEATGESGRVYSLPPKFFEPYDFQFTLGWFKYLSREPRLNITWGASSDRALADRLLEARTPAAVRRLEQTWGEVMYDEQRSEVFDEFMQRYITTFNRRRSKQVWLSPLHAPRQIWTFAREDAYDDSEPIVRVDVYQIMSMFDGERYLEIDRRAARSVRIDGDAARAASGEGG